MIPLNFEKYVACGNDFILIDDRNNKIQVLSTQQIAKWCHRRFGIGADGLILLQNSSIADFRMRIFNADGSEAEMCGNGIRCLARFIRNLGDRRDHFAIQTMHQIFTVELTDDQVIVEMPSPAYINDAVCLTINDQELKLHHLDTGVPHAVLFAESIENEELFCLAPYIRNHAHFCPKGTNVNIASVLSNEKVALRTYERGVEAETLACGTGAVATAIAAARAYQMKSPITVLTRSGEEMKIFFRLSERSVHDLKLVGPARKVYSGSASSLS